jgi:hypothetical protein
LFTFAETAAYSIERQQKQSLNNTLEYSPPLLGRMRHCVLAPVLFEALRSWHRHQQL